MVIYYLSGLCTHPDISRCAEVSCLPKEKSYNSDSLRNCQRISNRSPFHLNLLIDDTRKLKLISCWINDYRVRGCSYGPWSSPHPQLHRFNSLNQKEEFLTSPLKIPQYETECFRLSLHICAHTGAHNLTGIKSDTIPNSIVYTHRKQVNHHRPPHGKVNSLSSCLWEMSGRDKFK